jgi:hypothetical protein
MVEFLFVFLLAFLIWGPYLYTNWRVSKLEEKTTDMEDEEIEKSLKPCQVCGTLPNKYYGLAFNIDSKTMCPLPLYYKCPKCGTSSPQADTKKEAARRWNYKQDVMVEAMAKAEKRENKQDKEAKK